MSDSTKFQAWMEVRRRLVQEEKAFAEDHAAWRKGAPIDPETLSIQYSEIRALRALSRALLRRSLNSAERPS